MLLHVINIAGCASTAAIAQDFFDISAANLPSSATLEGGGDAAGSRNLTLQGDFGLASGARVRAGYAGAHVDTDGVGYTGGTYWAGLNSDPLAPFSYGANYELMRRDDGIHSAAAKANLRWRINNWRVAVYPELRLITLTETYATMRSRVRRVEATIRSPGVGAAVAYHGLEQWSFALRHFAYRYETDAQTLLSHPVFSKQVTSDVASHVDQSFDAWRSGVNVDYALSWGSVGLETTRSESAIGHATARSTAANLSWDVSHAWTLFAHVARSHAAGVSATGFASVGVTWMWGE